MNADSSVKIENDFDENKASRILSINKQNDDAVVNENSILISECDFEINKDSKSSIYFILGNSVTNIEVTQYNFMGMIANDAHHIDEKIIGKSSPKLSINLCKFSSNEKNSLKFDPNHNRKLIELKNQVFNYSTVRL